MPGMIRQQVGTTPPSTVHIYLRDGVHSALILEFALIIAVMAIALWWRFRQITAED